jgi:hypothetical protein
MTAIENNKELIAYRETFERDKLIFDSISNRYNLEWDRSKVLDGKASGIISFVGIILALQAGIGAILIKDAPKIGVSIIIINGFFILSVFFMTASIISGLKAFLFKKWYYIPELDTFFEECENQNKSNIDILRTLGLTTAHAIVKNEEDNDKRTKFIRYGFYFLLAGLILNLFFIIGLILIMNQ